jgi:hypothetical protein
MTEATMAFLLQFYVRGDWHRYYTELAATQRDVARLVWC